MAWIHSSNRSQYQSLMALFWSYSDYNAFRPTTSAMYKLSLQMLHLSLPAPIAPVYSRIANSPISYPIATEDITALVSGAHEIREGCI